MRTSTIMGWAFAAIVALELIGLGILRLAATTTFAEAGDRSMALAGFGERSIALAGLAMAWISGVWVALVVFFIFLIAWVIESMSVDGHEIDVRLTDSASGVPPH